MMVQKRYTKKELLKGTNEESSEQNTVSVRLRSAKQ